MAWSRWACGLREARLRRRALRLQRVDLPLRHFERRLRAIDSGLLGLEILDVGRALLRRRPTLLDERLVASPGDLARAPGSPAPAPPAPGWRRSARLAWRSARRCCGCRLRARHLRFGLRQRRAVIALVDPGDHVALVDMLVVGDRNRGDVARDLGRDRELARRDEGVVGRFEMRGMIPVEVSGRRRQQERDEADRRQDRMPAEEAFARFFAGLFPLRVGLLAGFALLLGGLRRALGLFGWLRRPLSFFRTLHRTFGRGRCLARRSAQGDDVPLGAR